MKRATIFILFFILENNVYFGTLFIIQNCILFLFYVHSGITKLTMFPKWPKFSYEKF